MADTQLDRSSLFQVGQGNWRRFNEAGYSVEQVKSLALNWKNQLSGIEKPWLCWNVDADWCLAQQKLVRHVGWTPVIGFDPRVGAPPQTVPGAIVIDFNEGLGLPVLYPHFVMEFAFLWAPRLAFWHSDLLVRLPLMERIASEFESLEDGATYVTKEYLGWRQSFGKRHKRYWELIGCTTQEASRQQFEKGCGWWMSFLHHVNCPSEAERKRRTGYHWDHGSGVYYWHRRYGGATKVLSDRSIHEGHFTKIGNPKFERSVPANTDDSRRSMAFDLARNYKIEEVLRFMGLETL